MAALCQDHGAGIFLPSPVASHEGVGLMPVSDVLDGLHGDDTSDPAAVDCLLYGLEELIESKTGITTMTAEDPMTAVAIGTGRYVEFLSGEAINEQN